MLKAQSMEHGVWSMEYGAWSMEHRAQSTEHRAWSTGRRGELKNCFIEITAIEFFITRVMYRRATIFCLASGGLLQVFLSGRRRGRTVLAQPVQEVLLPFPDTTVKHHTILQDRDEGHTIEVQLFFPFPLVQASRRILVCIRDKSCYCEAVRVSSNQSELPQVHFADNNKETHASVMLPYHPA